MAALPGDRLTEAHRARQIQNAAQLAAKIQQRWGGVIIGEPVSARNFVDSTTPLVMEHNRRSASLAVTYLRSLQALESPRTMPMEVEPAPLPSEEAVRTSLRVTGPLAYAQRIRRAQRAQEGTPARARAEAQARSSSGAGVVGSAIRHAQAGARDTTRLYVNRDGEAKAYVRITANDTRVCYFCAALASRVNWKDDSFDESDREFEGPGTAKVHDNCRCHLRPIYSGALPDSVLAYKQAWTDMSGGDADAMTNFRRNWEGRGVPGSQREVA